MTVSTLLSEAAKSIPRRDAELLLAHAINQPRTFLLAHPEHIPQPTEAPAFQTFVTRRAAGEPLQYLLGAQEFFGLSLLVSPAALIPRPETEHLVEAVLAWAHTQPTPLRILDIGTGTGAIALALATHLPHSEIVATDISTAALALARENAQRLALTGRIDFLESDLFAHIPASTLFDAIVSNPPYIPAADAPTLQPEVRNHEPHTALFAGPDGLDLYRRLIPQAFAALRPGGLLALELGFGQSAALSQLLAAWHGVRFLNDYAGIPRVALATRP